MRRTAIVGGMLAVGFFASPSLAAGQQGTGASDSFLGTPHADEVYLVGGNDVGRGRGANDVLAGGIGNDRLYGNTGADTLRGGPGYDLLVGGAGRDVLAGGAGVDDVIPGAGADVVRLGRGNDTVTLFPDGARDEVWCSYGIDTVIYDSGPDARDVFHDCELEAEILILP